MPRRILGIVTVLLVAVLGLLLLPGSSAAAATSCPTGGGSTDAISAKGQLLDNDKSPAEPVPGVTISVADPQGKVVGEATSDENGCWSIELPGTASELKGETLEATLDTETLPEGVALRDPDKATQRLTFTTALSADKNVTFLIGTDPNAATSIPVQALQLLVTGVLFSLVLALASLGLSMIFGTTGLVNFAHGELITFGAIVAYAFNNSLGLHVILAGVIATAVSGAFGWGQDLTLWRPLRNRGTGLVAMMIVSIGLSIFLRNVYQYLVGGDNHNYNQYATVEPWEIGPILLTPKSAIVAVVAIAVLVMVTLALQKTRIGKATRAVADNPALASASGINVDRVIAIVWIGGAALAGLSGFLLGMTQGFDYQIGFKLLLLVFAAVTLGGLGTIWGALVGSLVVGVFIEMSTLIIPPELKFAGALAVLIVVLLFRPQGLLGRAERVG